MLGRLFLGFTCAFVSLSVSAAEVRVEDAWARATAPGQPVGGAFMNLTADADMALVGARSPASRSVELHTMSMDNGVMSMRQLDKIDLPRGKTVSLKPGGLHIMFIDLKGPLRADETTRLTLIVQDKTGKKKEVGVEVPIRAMLPTPSGKHH